MDGFDGAARTRAPGEIVEARRRDENWTDRYLGKPWEAVPSPPDSYNCGELLRAVYMDQFLFDTRGIDADAKSLRSCVKAFDPAFFGLGRLAEGERPREFDTVFMGRAKYVDHCGIVAETRDGLMILHCLQDLGVVLDTPWEAAAQGFEKIEYLRPTSPVLEARVARYREQKHGVFPPGPAGSAGETDD